MPNLTSVTAYSCEGAERETGEEDTLQHVGHLDESALQANDEAKRICRDVIRTVHEKDYNIESVKNARTHRWDAETREDTLSSDSRTPKAVLNEVREGSDPENNAAALAQAYLEEDRSANDLLLFIRYEREGLDTEFLAIIKTPYIEDASDVNLDDTEEEVFVENEYVIQNEVDKGILYPRYTPEGLEENAADLYQEGGAGHWAQYWYSFLNFPPTDHPDEMLRKATKGYLSEEDTELNTYGEFARFLEEELPDQLEDEETVEDVRERSTISVKFRDKRFRVSLGEIERDEVQFAQQGDRYYVLISDPDPTFEVGTTSRTPILEDPSDFPRLSDLLEQ